MSDHFSAYNFAMSHMEQAEKRAAELVQDVRKRFEPLFQDWKTCYFADVVEPIPPILLRSGQRGIRNMIRTVDLTAIYNQIMIAMQTFAENEQEARNAWDKLSAEEKNRLKPPPWAPRMMTEPPHRRRF